MSVREFEVGETLIYPGHGVVAVEALETRVVKGSERDYVVLRAVGADTLVIRVPAENVDLVGLRGAMDISDVERVLAILAENVEADTENWSHRFKANADKINSGNIVWMAEAVRDLSQRDRSTGLSTAEKRLYAQALRTLLVEVSLSLGQGDEHAEAVIAAALSRSGSHDDGDPQDA